jgi:signal transduction histidine kinase
MNKNSKTKQQLLLEIEEYGTRLDVAQQRLQVANERMQAEMAGYSQAQAVLEECLKFETLLANLSADFINLPAEGIDSAIVDAQRQICQCLNIDRSTLWQITETEPREMLLTHVHQPPGSLEPPERMSLADFFPWATPKVLSGEVICLSKLSDLPPEAGRDLESFRKYGTQSNVIVPLSCGEGMVFGLVTFVVMREERIWTEEVVTGFKLIGHVFANALVRKRSYETLRRHEQELSRLTGRIINAQEAELKRLSHELHDDLTQRLAALAMDAALIEKQLNPTDPQAVQALKALKANLTDLADDVHDLSRQLHPSILEDLGLVQAVQVECNTFTKKTGIDLSFMHSNLPDSIPQHPALCLYRIIQEGLQNIAKHSQATAASITLQGFSGGINLLIRDDGIGFDPAEAKQKAGICLSSMHERARLVNGSIAIESKPGKGTEIKILIPLGEEHEQAAAADS